MFSTKETLSTYIAALLHDVGHCPFSHMGELEVPKKAARDRLLKAVDETDKTAGIKDILTNMDGTNKEGNLYTELKEFKGGATHELLSCVIILEKYRERIEEWIKKNIKQDLQDEVAVDYELIIRCILSMKYNITSHDYDENQKPDRIDEMRRKNLLIDLINSKMLDMDKLDYIMRDAFFTAINVPIIDTKRLFRNMYITAKYELVFTSRAVPTLQNLIEARDNLYLWVYNHHVSVYSEFLYSYIFRRLAHNTNEIVNEQGKKDGQKNPENAMDAGYLSTSRLFSVEAIVDDGVSDSDLVHTLNWQYRKYKELLRNHHFENNPSEVHRKRALEVIDRLQKREFLKSWWKTPFEFNAYLDKRFANDKKTRHELGERICYSANESFNATEFRSQIAKHVLHLVNNARGDGIELLKDGDFFIVQRSNKFFNKEDIKKLVIYLKPNDILGPPQNEKVNAITKDSESHYFEQPLTELMPYKKYDEIYEKGGFYIYLRRYHEKPEAKITKKDYYDLIDNAFVYVAKKLTSNLEREEFMAMFCSQDEQVKKDNEIKSKEDMLIKFKKNWKEGGNGKIY